MVAHAKSCIDVAVDHRLESLLAPFSFDETSHPGNHSELIRNLAHLITRPKEDISQEEVDFTVWLSQPSLTGGIVVLLHQPANNHPYHLGQEVTFSSCATLVALDECFSFVSCGCLTLENITIIDSLPYTRKKDNTTSDYKRQVRNYVLRILQAKQPSIVLCMWSEKDGVPLSMVKFRSLGVGKTFEKTIVRLGSDHYSKRVNGFHPSYALFHRPTESVFRQLLLLEIARTCGEMRGDWEEADWMQDLRQRCQVKAKATKPLPGYVNNI